MALMRYLPWVLHFASPCNASSSLPGGCSHSRDGFARRHEKPRQGRGLRPTHVCPLGDVVSPFPGCKQPPQAQSKVAESLLCTALTQSGCCSVPVGGKRQVRECERASHVAEEQFGRGLIPSLGSQHGRRPPTDPFPRCYLQRTHHPGRFQQTCPLGSALAFIYFFFSWNVKNKPSGYKNQMQNL